MREKQTDVDESITSTVKVIYCDIGCLALTLRPQALAI